MVSTLSKSSMRSSNSREGGRGKFLRSSNPELKSKFQRGRTVFRSLNPKSKFSIRSFNSKGGREGLRVRSGSSPRYLYSEIKYRFLARNFSCQLTGLRHRWSPALSCVETNKNSLPRSKICRNR